MICQDCRNPDCRECGVCGEWECSHHEFTPRIRPAGCCCDGQEWGDPANIPPVCESHQGDPGKNCQRCEHDAACHTEGQP